MPDTPDTQKDDATVPAQFKIYPIVGGLLASLLYVLLATVGASHPTTSESRLLVHPPRGLQGVYAGQLDRYVANELEVLMSRSALETAAQSAGTSTADVSKATTAVIEPGTDVVVLKVTGLGDGKDEAVAKSLVKTYTEQTDRATEADTDTPAKDLEKRSTEIAQQIDELSTKIARAQRGATNTDPSVVAPVENSRRNLLTAQHAQLQEQLLTLQMQGSSAPSVQVISSSNTVEENTRSLSPFNLAAAFLGGAALGFMLALLHVRLRGRAGSWSEVESALQGRDWVAVEAAGRHHGSSPLTDHLTRRMMERAAAGRETLVEIVDAPGSGEARRQAEDAAAMIAGIAPATRVRVTTVDTGSVSPDALCVMPYRAGAVGKRDLAGLAEHAPRAASLILAEVGAVSRRGAASRTEGSHTA